MPDQLLITKLNTPPLRPGLVARPRLIERLNQGLSQGRRLTLISAPAGYGKTTVVCDWLNRKDEAAQSGRRMKDENGLVHPSTALSGFISPPSVSWLALDEGDDDPARFFAYLVAAFRKAPGLDAATGQATLDLVASPHLPPARALMTPLINEIASPSARGDPSVREVPSCRGGVVLVLDDLHTVHAPLIFDALDFLIQHGPPDLHLVLLTREDPPLSLATLRARGQMTELRTQDLRFTEDEALAFFSATMGLELDPAAAGGLEARTEGWVAGLQLAALSVQGWPVEDVNAFVAAFSGSDRYVMDYLIEQVARRLPPEIHSFVQATAILDRMNASLCDAVTGRTDSRAMLQRLDQANMFLVRLDAQGQWFRFHHLFAELMRVELDGLRQIELHRRAAGWFEENGLLPEAIQHALAGQDYAGAARLMGLAAGALLRTSEFRTLLGWIDKLPPEIVALDAELCVHRATAAFFTGDVKGAAAWLDQLQSARPGPASPLPPPQVQGRLLALAAWLATLRDDMQTARRCGEQALQLIARDETFYRMAALLALGHAQSAAGDTLAEEQTYREIVALGRQSGHALATAAGLLTLAFNLLRQGRLREVQAMCEDGLAEHVDRRGSPLPVARILYLPLAAAFYQANRLEEARDCAVKGLEASRQLLSEEIMGGDGELTLALSQYGLGEKEAAFATLAAARAAAERLGYAHVARAFAAIEADLNLRAGNDGPARNWLATRRAAMEEPPVAEREVEYRAYVRFLVTGRAFPEAEALLHALEREARDGGRWTRAAGTLVWRGVVAHGLHNTREALACLEDAVRFAAPEGFRRMFIDVGQPALVELLPQVRGVAPEFVDDILQSLAREIDVAGSSHTPRSREARPAGTVQQALVETLSVRELEVLALLAEGLSYRQVAEKLIVAMGTVQAHCGNIYGKLGVNNRTQALAKARELRLL